MSSFQFEASKDAMRRASAWLAGGVSSNFRQGIAPTPLVFSRGDGARLLDADGNWLIDYYLGMGPMILGHRCRAPSGSASGRPARKWYRPASGSPARRPVEAGS